MKRTVLVMALVLTSLSFLAQERDFKWNGTTGTFVNGTENLVTYINFGDAKLWGWVEITVTGSYSHRLTTGKYTKRFQIGKNPAGGHFSQASEVPTNFGPVGAEWKIGEFEFVNGNLRIPIYHLLTTQNRLDITITGMSLHAYDTNNITISPITTLVNSETRDYVLISGNVGIGTGDTKGFKLGVNGKIAATEVKVATYANWPDYVFTKEYKLPSLEEVENHINEKGHLLNIPSAKEVKENDGIELGKMNAKLLQKIEELTLYTIQQEKEIQELKIHKITIEKIEKENKILKKRLDKLDRLVNKFFIFVNLSRPEIALH